MQTCTRSQETPIKISFDQIQFKLKVSEFERRKMSELDKIDLLRTLVINENLPGFDYTAHRFSFRTVFKRESYMYCCCNCAFEHEYMLYISDKGEINKEIFYRVVQNISLGECSHVKDVSEEFVTETSVGAIHIAAARGNKKAALWHLDALKYLESANLYAGEPISKTGIFELLPYDIAALKGQRHIMKLYERGLVMAGFGPLVPINCFWDKDRAIVSVHTVPRQNISQCITNTNPRENNENAIAASHGSRFIRMPEFISRPACPRFQPEFRSRPGTQVPRHIPRNTAPIRTNISDQRFLQRMCMPHPRFQSPPLRMNQPQPIQRMLLSDSNANNNAQTTVVLDDRQMQEDSHDFQKEILELTSQLLSHYDELKTEIVEALRRIPLTKRETDRNLNNYLTLPHMRNDFFKTVISLGGNINFLSAFGKPAIDSMLKVKPINDVIMVREKVAIMIYENPDLNLHNKSVRRALKRDMNFQGRAFISSFRANKLSCTYKTDAKTHGIFGYDAKSDFALNFMGPFLMECGFPVDRKEIKYLVEHEQVPPFCLHKAVIEYVHSFLENPRPLIAMCRDTLRRHFKGRAIHGYVELVNCPVKIKDIILMKTILNYEGGNVVP